MSGSRHRIVLLTTLALAAGGCGRKDARETAPADANAAALQQTGADVYDLYCSVCHMPDGGGVPNFQPALRGSAIVDGDPAKLEAVVRAGSEALRDRQPLYAAEMPPFGTLSDDEVKAIVAYVRERFGAAAGGKTP
jgi:mono/diheme cytochrome c family protein